MLDKQVQLRILTPDGIFLDEKVNILTVKTTEGYIGLQINHLPFVAALDIAELQINSKKSLMQKICAIAGGLIMSSQKEIIIFTDAIEYQEKIDLVRAQKAQKDAEAKVHSHDLTHSESRLAELSLKRALNRIKVQKSK